jgi:hypothetical protein
LVILLIVLIYLDDQGGLLPFQKLHAQTRAEPDSPLVPRVPPAVQVTPLPDDQATFTFRQRELVRYHHGPQTWRPFLYPVNGPSGQSLTRMGHPHDPHGHSHHNSVWIAHNDVDGHNFWSDRAAAGRIVHQKVVGFEDGNEAATISTHNRWQLDIQTKMEDYRRFRVQPLASGESLIEIDVHLHAAGKPVTLGKTPFGLVSVRMAKSIGVHDGAGRIRNSEGGVNEAGVFWKQARWCDYSGAIAQGIVEGITLMDHPGNVNHPTVFHVRDDGWMGSSLTFDGPRTIEPGSPLRLRYGLYVHAGLPSVQQLQARWEDFARTTTPEVLLPPKPR